MTASLAGGVEDAALARAWGVPSVWRFRSVGSTNDVARALGDAGAEAGTTVVAEEQLRGRGRSGDPWVSAAGLGAWLSVLLRPAPGIDSTLLPLHIGLAAAGALDVWLPPPGAGIRWPNDLLWQGRKLAGVLCEASRGRGGTG
ncbi:MAG: biotin--[acetyl-CoA-carboxylase] ligase family protein, partial [Gemmatimonadota bacterium]|nr:biotin--[acetyl-CoA-carboxylase] ligase family protein [Gemmatimonadota bacterium]